MWLILDNPWVCLIFMIIMYTMKVIILIFTYMEYLISTNSKFNALRDGDAGNSNIMTFILYKTFIQVSKTQIISYFFTFWVYASKGTGTDWADLVFFMKSRPGMTRKWCQTAWHNFFVIQIGLTNCAYRWHLFSSMYCLQCAGTLPAKKRKATSRRIAHDFARIVLAMKHKWLWSGKNKLTQHK